MATRTSLSVRGDLPALKFHCQERFHRVLQTADLDCCTSPGKPSPRLGIHSVGLTLKIKYSGTFYIKYVRECIPIARSAGF